MVRFSGVFYELKLCRVVLGYILFNYVELHYFILLIRNVDRIR